jgi:hypothetical protein
MQKGEGFTLNRAKMKLMAHSVFSPSESRLMALRRLKGGEAKISIPESISSPSERTKSALPPPNMAVKIS